MSPSPLSKGEKSLIVNLLRSQIWTVVDKLAKLLVDKIKTTPIDVSSGWSTTRSALENAYKVEGILALLQELENVAKEDTE